MVDAAAVSDEPSTPRVPYEQSKSDPKLSSRGMNLLTASSFRTCSFFKLKAHCAGVILSSMPWHHISAVLLQLPPLHGIYVL